MFWLVSQVAERHQHDRKLVNRYRYSEWRYEKTNYRYTHDPRRGIGKAMWIEGDTATDVWRYLLKINNRPSRWRRPRYGQEKVTSVHDYIRRYYSVPTSVPGVTPSIDGPIYVHFTDGTFFRIDELRKEVVDALTQIGAEHDW